MFNDTIRDALASVGLLVALYFVGFPDHGRYLGELASSVVPKRSRRRRVVRLMAMLGAAAVLLLGITYAIDQERVASASRGMSTSGTIVYVSDANEKERGSLKMQNIYTSRPDGTETQQVTYARDKHFPSFAPDGFTFVYADTTIDGETRLCRWSLWSHRAPEPLLSEKGVINDHPAWSPDGETIAFQSSSKGRTRIRILDLSSGHAKYLQDQIGRFNYENPAWSADGTLLAFTCNSEDESVLEVRNLENGESRTWVHVGRKLRDPAFRPGTDQLTFVDQDESSGKGTIYSVRPFTRDRKWQEFKTIHSSVCMPAWSAEGSRLAYLAVEDGEWHLFMATPSGANLQRLTDYPTSKPAWRPKHDAMLYGAVKEGGYELELYDIANESSSRLTYDSGLFSVPRLAPDGASILTGIAEWKPFAGSWRFGIGVITSKGLTVRSTTRLNVVNAYNPSWSPDGTRVCFDGAGASSSRRDSFAADWPSMSSSKRLANNVDDESVTEPSWLSDDTIVARVGRNGHYGIAVVSSAGGGAVTWIAGPEGEDGSPDGHASGSIAFVSKRDKLEDEAGHELQQIYVAATNGDQAYRLTTPDGATSYSHPHWSPEGDALVVQATRWNPDTSERNEVRVLRLVRRLIGGRREVARDYPVALGSDPSWSAASASASLH